MMTDFSRDYIADVALSVSEVSRYLQSLADVPVSGAISSQLHAQHVNVVRDRLRSLSRLLDDLVSGRIAPLEDIEASWPSDAEPLNPAQSSRFYPEPLPDCSVCGSARVPLVLRFPSGDYWVYGVCKDCGYARREG